MEKSPADGSDLNGIQHQAAGNGAITATGANTASTIDVAGDTSDSALKIDGNSAITMATGNDGVSALSLKAASVLATAGVNSVQTSKAGITSQLGTSGDKAGAVISIGGQSGDSSLSVTGNGAGSAAIGNRAANTISVEATTLGSARPFGFATAGRQPGGVGADAETPMRARAYGVTTPAGAILANRQDNAGTISAATIATSPAVALNCGCTGESRIGVTASVTTAAAYGNAALNAAALAGGNPSSLALVSNIQVNHGPVSARVASAIPAIMTSGVSASTLAVTGNSIAATAIGNQAVNAITVSR